MNGDLISRKALISRMFPYGMPDGGNYGINAKAVRDAVMGAKAVEAEPVVHAHWELRDLCGDGCSLIPYCSNCGQNDGGGYERCPHCGAHMDEGVSA